MRKLILLLFVLVSTVGVGHAFAEPAADLRVIMLDFGSFGSGTKIFSVVPVNEGVGEIDNANEIVSAERLAVFGGNVYAANSEKISKLTLDADGFPDPMPPANNVEDVTGNIFNSLFGIAIDSNGLIYVVDNANEIYSVDPSGAPLAGKSQVAIDTEFEFIRHIIIHNDVLYVLDLDADGGNGAIFAIDLLTPPPTEYEAVMIYSGANHEPITFAHSIAALDDTIYISGEFNSGMGVLKFDINTNTVSPFSLGLLGFPTGITIDPVGNDLYVSDPDVPSLYRFNLDDASQFEEIADGLFVDPADLAVLYVEGELPTEIAELEILKIANVTSVPPGTGILYTLVATNVGGDTATQIRIHDFFPDTLSGQVESVINNGQLSFTSEVNRSGTVTQEGECERRGGNQFIVDCTGYGPLEVGDFVTVTLEGKVLPFSTGVLTNRAQVENFGAAAENSISTQVVTSVTFSSVTKTATPGTVTAGDGSVSYVVRIDNTAPNTSNANNVTVTDVLPDGISSVSITSQPSPSSCQIIPDGDNPSEINCGPYTILNNSFIEIKYTAVVGSDAQNPFANDLSVTCDECASVQSATATTEIVHKSVLSIIKETSESSVIAGHSLSYDITVTNNGPSDADDIIVTDTLPSGTVFDSASSASCSDNDGVVTCNLGSMQSGHTETVTIVVHVEPGTVATITNTATVSDAKADFNSFSDTVTADPVNVIVSADLALEKTGPSNAVAGGTIDYVLTVTNPGPSTATGVIVTDVLPGILEFIPASSESTTDPDCGIVFGSLECSFDSLAPNTTTSKVIQASIPIDFTGEITNEASISRFDNDADVNGDNNNAFFTTTIDPPFCGKPESAFDSVIHGTPGNDVIHGTNGDDLIFGYEGNNKIHGKGGDDCIIVGDGDNLIHGTPGDDTILAGNGNNRIHGNQGNDHITAGDGDNRIWGGQGDDIILAGNGNNRIHGNQGNDHITSGSGNDWIHGGAGNDVIYAGAGDDKIFGGPGHDNLSGEDGNDIIHGGAGNDSIDGGDGTDKCHGASGNNTIVNCEMEDKKIKEENEEPEVEDFEISEKELKKLEQEAKKAEKEAEKELKKLEQEAKKAEKEAEKELKKENKDNKNK